MYSVGTWWLWTGFIVFILAMLAFDMFLLGHKKNERVSVKEASLWTFVWFSFAVLFGILLWWYLLKTTSDLHFANQKALEFFTGYIIEESLSVDNIFVFIMIFGFFQVPEALQRRVLLFGVIGAIVMRLAMILFGTWVVRELHWILYLFGLFLIFTGIKMLWMANQETDLENNFLLNGLRRHLRVTHAFHKEHFFIKQHNLWYATPLFLVLILIEFSDLIFALDSIPAIFAVTHDPFIIFTSNIFAILGLRALYFVLADMAGRFSLLKYGIALILVIVGIKMLIEPWILIPISWALGAVIVILGGAIGLSILKIRG